MRIRPIDCRQHPGATHLGSGPNLPGHCVLLGALPVVVVRLVSGPNSSASSAMAWLLDAVRSGLPTCSSCLRAFEEHGVGRVDPNLGAYSFNPVPVRFASKAPKN